MFHCGDFAASRQDHLEMVNPPRRIRTGAGAECDLGRKHLFDSPTDTRCCFRLFPPDRSQHLEDVLGRYIAHGQATDLRIDVDDKGPIPLACVLDISPAHSVLCYVFAKRLGDGSILRGLQLAFRLLPSPHFDRILPRATHVVRRAAGDLSLTQVTAGHPPRPCQRSFCAS